MKKKQRRKHLWAYATYDARVCVESNDSTMAMARRTVEQRVVGPYEIVQYHRESKKGVGHVVERGVCMQGRRRVDRSQQQAKERAS